MNKIIIIISMLFLNTIIASGISAENKEKSMDASMNSVLTRKSSLILKNPPSAFQEKEIVCFVGDSITHSGTYHVYIAGYYATRFPKRPMKMYNLGIGGHTAKSTMINFDWDIPPLKPSVVAIMLGMNDLGYQKSSCHKLDHYEKSMQNLINRVKQTTTAKIVLVTPTPYDEYVPSSSRAKKGYNQALSDACQRLFKLEKSNKTTVVDLNTPMNDLMNKERKENPGFTLIGKDRIHPGPLGHLIISYLFLKSQNVPSLVSNVAINAKTGNIEKGENCKLSNVSVKNDRISFELISESLPMPLPEGKAAKKALSIVPFCQDLNREMLRITGLDDGVYDLNIDGKNVGNYSAKKLAVGINLAFNKKTPQYQQAQRVLKLCMAKNDLEYKLRTEAALRVWLHQKGVPFKSGDREYIDKRFSDEKVLSQFKPGGRMMSSADQRYWKRYVEYRHEASKYPAMIEKHIQDIYRMSLPKAHSYSVIKSKNKKEIKNERNL